MITTALAMALTPVANPPVDLARLLECRVPDVASYGAVATGLIDDPDGTYARSLDLIREAPGDTILQRYRLRRPVTAFGRTVRHIGFSATAVLAILDERDPHPLARQLGIVADIDRTGKYLGEKVVHEKMEAVETDVNMLTRITLNVSTIDSLPGKTLAGCSYTIDAE